MSFFHLALNLENYFFQPVYMNQDNNMWVYSIYRRKKKFRQDRNICKFTISFYLHLDCIYFILNYFQSDCMYNLTKKERKRKCFFLLYILWIHLLFCLLPISISCWNLVLDSVMLVNLFLCSNLWASISVWTRRKKWEKGIRKFSSSPTQIFPKPNSIYSYV